ncbi:UNKNOWN [Stylonychia lemnae]|uniref:Uncharacterized protein n=1 Tax=Stylonychia lemnae TaxID=5949 RepID=A0A078ARG1_STYLE|nr:UNKNOWN [Stylonychia lemnae]|eukprot:CDW85045.1 UNKNOWN [Stylonychia lemnae]
MHPPYIDEFEKDPLYCDPEYYYYQIINYFRLLLSVVTFQEMKVQTNEEIFIKVFSQNTTYPLKLLEMPDIYANTEPDSSEVKKMRKRVKALKFDKQSLISKNTTEEKPSDDLAKFESFMSLENLERSIQIQEELCYQTEDQFEMIFLQISRFKQGISQYSEIEIFQEIEKLIAQDQVYQILLFSTKQHKYQRLFVQFLFDFRDKYQEGDLTKKHQIDAIINSIYIYQLESNLMEFLKEDCDMVDIDYKFYQILYRNRKSFVFPHQMCQLIFKITFQMFDIKNHQNLEDMAHLQKDATYLFAKFTLDFLRKNIIPEDPQYYINLIEIVKFKLGNHTHSGIIHLAVYVDLMTFILQKFTLSFFNNQFKEFYQSKIIPLYNYIIDTLNDYKLQCKIMQKTVVAYTQLFLSRLDLFIQGDGIEMIPMIFSQYYKYLDKIDIKPMNIIPTFTIMVKQLYKANAKNIPAIKNQLMTKIQQSLIYKNSNSDFKLQIKDAILKS